MGLGLYTIVGTHGFSCRKRLSLAPNRMVYGNNALHFSAKVQLVQPRRLACTRLMGEPILLSGMALCFTAGALPSRDSQVDTRLLSRFFLPQRSQEIMRVNVLRLDRDFQKKFSL